MQTMISMRNTSFCLDMLLRYRNPHINSSPAHRCIQFTRSFSTKISSARGHEPGAHWKEHSSDVLEYEIPYHISFCRLQVRKVCYIPQLLRDIFYIGDCCPFCAIKTCGGRGESLQSSMYIVEVFLIVRY